MTVSPAPTVAGARTGRTLPVPLLAGVYVVALGGRFTLDRVGVTALGELDLRLVGGGVLALAGVCWWLDPRWSRERHALAPSIPWTLALFALMALSAAWSPSGADVAGALTDLAVLAALVVAVVVLTAPDPERGARVLVTLSLAAGVLYAVLGLVTGQTDVQGRTAILGGGPNVYVRVVCLGIVAAIAVAVVRRSWLVLATVPVMGVAAVLSGSRGGLLAAAVAALVFLVAFRRRWSLRWLAGLGATCLAGATVGLLTVGARLGEVVDDRFVSGLTAGGDYSERPGLLDAAATLFARHPVVGGGLAGFRVRYGGTVDQDYPHNLVAEVAVTAGLVGLALLAVVLVRLVVDARVRAPLTVEQVALVIGAVYVLAESMVSGDLYDTRFFWIFAVAVVNLRSSSPGEGPWRDAPI